VEPSLTSIKTFEAAARHLSFARAARQLGVQPPAVSRQVAELERALGVRLFVRSKPRLALTRPGQELYRSVSLGLNEIRQGCDRLRLRDDDETVRVVTSIGITSCWLLPRLVDFYERHPDADLQLTTRDSTTNLDPQEADVIILFGGDDLPGVEARNIFRETMIPVCNSALLPGGRQFSAQELVSQPLLHYAEPAHRDDWRRLLGSAGLQAPTPGRGTTFNSYVVYLQAAINGAGIAIGWEHLLEDYLENGSLCRAAALRLETRQGYFCCLTGQGVDKPAARKFMNWVCALVD
jgi:LysR family glycine cleavage system transcriptional activator